MSQHRKHPTFIRIKSTDDRILLLNPNNVLSFQVIRDVLIKAKPGGTPEHKGTIIRIYTSNGFGLDWELGVDITEDEYAYICTCMDEWIYQHRAEFDAEHPTETYPARD